MASLVWDTLSLQGLKDILVEMARRKLAMNDTPRGQQLSTRHAWGGLSPWGKVQNQEGFSRLHTLTMIPVRTLGNEIKGNTTTEE